MKYGFIKNLSINTANGFTTTLCSDELGNKVVIKKYRGSKHDGNYSRLLYESRVGKILSTKSTLAVKFPDIVEVKRKDSEISVVYEYIPGRLLSGFSLDYQAKAILRVINGLTEITKKLSAKDKEFIVRRTFFDFIIGLPIFCLLFLKISPRNFLIVSRAFFDCLVNLPKLYFRDLALAHCDLKPENIIVSRGMIYLLDCELTRLTHRKFDYNKIIASRVNPRLSDLLHKNHQKLSNSTLINYLCLCYGSSRGRETSYTANYLASLNKYNP